MTTTTILNDGRHIPNLAFGTGSVHVGQDVTTQVLAALNAGFTHIDTAQWYRNEYTVGKALNEFLNTRNDKTDVDVDVENGFYRPNRRETIWVTTKLGDGTHGAVGELHKSLKRVMPSTVAVAVAVADEGYLPTHVARTRLRRSLPHP